MEENGEQKRGKGEEDWSGIKGSLAVIVNDGF